MTNITPSLVSRSLLAAAVLAAIAGTAVSQPDTPTLWLQAAQVDVSALPNALSRAGAQPQRLPERMVMVIDGPMTPAKRAGIEAAGVAIGDYLPDRAWIIETANADINALKTTGVVSHLVAYRDAWKIDPQLGQRTYQSDALQAITSADKVPAQVYLFPGEQIQDAIAELAATPGIEIKRHELLDGRFMIMLTGSQVQVRALAKLDSVQWIEPAPEITLRNSTTRWIVQSNTNGQTPIYDAGIKGDNQLVAVIDSRVDTNHCSFTDPEGDPFGDDHRKIQAYNTSTGSSFHGTHVAGTVLGDAGSSDDRRGIAYESRLVFDTTPSFSFAAMNSRLSQHYAQGAAIHTNSWGDDGTTSYTGLARAIDSFSHENDDNLVIFAVTNLSSLRSPENAKNVLAVGATQDANAQGSFCTGGAGPTADGRRKPELFAPGCDTLSSRAFSSCGTTGFTGTSMAAPAIAGCAALTRQYFQDGYYPTGAPNFDDGFTPSGSLLKATLLNGSVNMTGINGYPSNQEGWGRILLDNALYFPGDDRTMLLRDVRNNAADAMETGDDFEMTVTSESIAEELRVTLVWHDAPATPGSFFTPVNNLDLEVILPTGQTVLGNNIVNGASNFSTDADEINNVEMVMFPAPLDGDYTIRVKGTEINDGPQGYALVITGAVAEASACPPDLTGDGNLDFFDISAFLNGFNAQDPAADFNNDGIFDFFDVSAFLNAFNAGCP